MYGLANTANRSKEIHLLELVPPRDYANRVGNILRDCTLHSQLAVQARDDAGPHRFLLQAVSVIDVKHMRYKKINARRAITGRATARRISDKVLRRGLPTP